MYQKLANITLKSNIYLNRHQNVIFVMTFLPSKCYLCLKFVFYRPEHNAKEESHGTEFVRSGNAKMTFITKYSSKSQRIEKKNWVICRLMMLTPGFIVIRMSKKVLVWEKY